MCLCTSISFACLFDAVRSPWCFKYLTITAISVCLLREPSLNIAFQSYSWYVLLASADFLVKVQKEVKKEEQDIKDHLNSLYSKYGLSKGSQRDFDEERITVLTMLRKKIIQNIQHLQDAENKWKDKFHGHILKFKSKKRSKRENKRKAQLDEKIWTRRREFWFNLQTTV